MNKTLTVLFAATIYLVSPIAHAATYYFYNDHLGTPQALSDVSQNIVWRGEYEPFGEVTETVNSVEQNLRFPGQYYDQESGVHYNYFRDYDPSLGRYVQSDPIGLRGGLNTYAYVGGNPLMNIDPFGLDVAIVTGGGHGGNPFGHTAMAVTGEGVCTYGTRHPDGSSFIGYLEDRSQIENIKFVEFTNLTDAQEQALINAFQQNKAGDYNLADHNCATVVNDSISDIGLGFPYSFNPSIPTPAFSNTMAEIYSALNGGNSTSLSLGASIPSVLNQYNPK